MDEIEATQAVLAWLKNDHAIFPEENLEINDGYTPAVYHTTVEEFVAQVVAIAAHHI